MVEQAQTAQATADGAEPAPSPEEAGPSLAQRERPNRKLIEGKVTSTKMRKTITVEATHLTLHPKYKKFVKRYTRFKAHDEHEEAAEGDTVEIQPTRPLSKTKRYRLVRVVRRANR